MTYKREPLPPNTNVEKDWVSIVVGCGDSKQTYLTKRVRLGAVYDVCDCAKIREQLGRGERLDNICPYCNHLQVKVDPTLEVKERKKLVNSILMYEKQDLIRISRTPKSTLEQMSNEELFMSYKNCDELKNKLTHDMRYYEIPCFSCGKECAKQEINSHGTIEIEPDEFGFNTGSLCHKCYEEELKYFDY